MKEGKRFSTVARPTEFLMAGKYKITRYSGDDYWIQNDLGEGMQCRKVKFEKLIDDFFNSEF